MLNVSSKIAANILVGQDGRVQLCDFGVSAQLVGKSGKRNTFVGTPQWMAPEALTGGSYDSRIDIWSFGITIIEMAKQNPPLFNIPPNRVVDMIPRLPPPRLEGGNWSNNLREFVALCLNEVPDERATVDELLRSKFVKGSKGYPSSLMRELIVRYEQWASRGGVRDSMWQAALQSDMDQFNATLASEPGWDFDTVKSRLSGVGEYIAKEMGSSASTLKATYRAPPTSEAARQRTAEGLVRLFQSPEEEAQAMQNGGARMGLGPGSDLSFRSGASSRSTTPEQKVSMISIPSFDDNGLRVPEKSTAPPLSQISIPSEDETMRLAHAKAASAPRSTPTPPLLDKDRAPMVRIRRNRAGSAGASGLRPNGLSSSPTPPPMGPLPGPPTGATDRDISPSPGRRPSMAASAPSSPPRLPNPHGLKSHHLPSKSAPNIAAPGNGVPPLPTIRGGLVAGANGPHGKSRSQDITGLGLARDRVGMRGMGNKPGSLNLNLPPGTTGNETNSNGGLGMLPPSPSRPYYSQHTPQGSFSSIQGIGLSSLSSQASLIGGSGGSMTSITTSMSGSTLRDGEGGWGAGPGGFPVIQPLDVSVLPLDGEDPRMLEELDRVLAGLGDALEVMQVGLKGMRKWRDREEVGEGGEGES